VDFFQDQAWNLLRAIFDGEISTVANPDCWGGKQKHPTRLVVEPNPSEKICSSNWILSPNFRGEFSLNFELPPPRISRHHENMDLWNATCYLFVKCFLLVSQVTRWLKKRPISRPSTYVITAFATQTPLNFKNPSPEMVAKTLKLKNGGEIS